MQITEFMRAADQVVPEMPGMPDLDTRILRVRLILEELKELAEAYGGKLVSRSDGNITFDMTPETLSKASLRDAYDAVLDLKYVVEGSSIAMGLDLEPGFEEVHDSNMSKFIDGHKDESGKWIKGPSYRPANLQPIIDAQIESARARQQQATLTL